MFFDKLADYGKERNRSKTRMVRETFRDWNNVGKFAELGKRP